MKHILILLFLFIGSFATAQQALHSGKYRITRPNNTTNVVPSTFAFGDYKIDRLDINSGTVEGQGNLLMTGVNDYFFWFNTDRHKRSIHNSNTHNSYSNESVFYT